MPVQNVWHALKTTKAYELVDRHFFAARSSSRRLPDKMILGNIIFTETATAIPTSTSFVRNCVSAGVKGISPQVVVEDAGVAVATAARRRS